MSRIGVIGAGRVGAVLCHALRAAGHEIVAAAAESTASRERVATLLPGVPVRKPTGVARACDLLLLTVPDDMLGNVAAMLAASGAIRPGQLVVHSSGRHGRAVLLPAEERGAHTAAMHPAMTFGGTATDVARLPGCVYAVSADEATGKVIAGLVADLRGTPAWVPEERRALYHAGLAHGANHLVTLVTQAAEIVEAAGVDDPGAVLRPLLTAALDNALREGDAALTGPIVRGDVETVRIHLAELAATAPEALESYVALGRATVNRAVLDGRLLPIRAAALVGALNDAPSTASGPVVSRVRS